jgi:hypothetical protein
MPCDNFDMAETSMLMLPGGFISACTALERAIQTPECATARANSLCNPAVACADAGRGNGQLTTFDHGFVVSVVLGLAMRSAKSATKRHVVAVLVLVLEIRNSH